MSSHLQTVIQQQLESTFSPLSLELIDESHLHAGHGAKGGHYKLHIVADAFSGKSLLQRHRLVYDALNDLMNSEIHALSIQAKTPSEMERLP
ncbi:MAG: BolA family transcriptional regulator [Candidatus Polarisedimenticolaceae bacterium]|nr:BolA family transcriptional regulator [Candidatus Polarisedimenticolaceae bacterium]